MTLLLYMDKDNQYGSLAYRRVFQKGTELECIAACADYTICGGIQIVYNMSGGLDITRKVKWCALIGLNGSDAAFVTANSNESTTTAFLTVRNWILTSMPSSVDLSPQMIDFDQMNSPTAYIKKGTFFRQNTKIKHDLIFYVNISTFEKDMWSQFFLNIIKSIR